MNLVNDHVWLCHLCCVQLYVILSWMLLCVSYYGLIRYLDLYLNRIFTTYIWDVSSHIVNVMLYCLICLSFFKYRIDGFRPLSMCSRPYISVFKITGIPVPFSFPKISYRFHFQWKNVKVKVVEFFTDHFRLFSSLCQSDPRAYGMMERRTSRVTPRVSPHCWQ